MFSTKYENTENPDKTADLGWLRGRRDFCTQRMSLKREGVSKCTFWLHPRRCVRMAKMQDAEDEGAGSVLKYMTKPETDSNEADWLL